MALERARGYELRERFLGKQAIRFYNLATKLLGSEGLSYTRQLGGPYLVPIEGQGQGGGAEVREWSEDFSYMVFAARINTGENIFNLVLASSNCDRESFGEYLSEINPKVLHYKDYETHNFALFIIDDDNEVDVGEIISSKKPALYFDLSGQESTIEIVVHGKRIFEGMNFVQGISRETEEEFLEIVDLIKSLSVNKDSYTKIILQKEAPALDKA